MNAISLQHWFDRTRGKKTYSQKEYYTAWYMCIEELTREEYYTKFLQKGIKQDRYLLFSMSITIILISIISLILK